MTTTKPYRCVLIGTDKSCLIWADDLKQAEERAAEFFSASTDMVAVFRKWSLS